METTTTTTTTTTAMTAMRGEDGGGEGGMEWFLATGESFTARGVNPARALTVGLTSTYMAINKRYYEVMETRRTLNEESPHVSPSRPGARVSETSTTEAEGANLSSPKRRASVNARDVVNERYLFDKILGRGSFGKVVLAYDLAEDKHVAVKVIERSERSDAAVDQEIEFLREINNGGSVLSADVDKMSISGRSDKTASTNTARGRESCVKLLDVFVHSTDKVDEEFKCLVFEIMSHSLYDLLRVTNLCGVSIKLTRKFAQQIVHALEYTRSLGIIHCDIKPENVLLCHPERSAVKLIDFGSACKCGKQQFSYVQSRFYRAPEVMLGMEYGPAIDMWSAGCMLYELRTGKPLFTGWSEHDQLCRIEASLGVIPQSMHANVPVVYKTRYFERGTRRMIPSQEIVRLERKNGTPAPEPGSRPLANILRDELVKRESMHASNDDRGDVDVEGMTASTTGAGAQETPVSEDDARVGKFDEEHEVLLSLISAMVTFDPNRRISPENALAHPFFYPLAKKSPATSRTQAFEKRLASIPDMSSVDELNARESTGGVGERFSFDKERR